MAKDKVHEQDSFESIEETLTRSEQFIENNQKIISYVVIGILALVAIYMAYMRFVQAPKEKEALAQMYVAEQYFEQDSFAMALNGDANYPGFLEIIDEFSGTNAGRLANYYAGICYLRTGDYDNAIKYLENYKSDDMSVSIVAKGATGDAYMEKGDVEKAISFYKKAVSNTNDFLSPVYLMKLGMAYESQNKNAEAEEAYTRIKTDFSQSREARQIEKYITRVKQ